MIAEGGMGRFTGVRSFVEALYDNGMTLQDIDNAYEFFRLWQMRDPPGSVVLANAPPGKPGEGHLVGRSGVLSLRRERP
jgi:hypothetical protein